MPKRRRAYPTDLSDRQWAAIADLVPDALPGGRPRRAASRELVNAILYALRAGHAWRLLPHDFPPWQTRSITTCAAGRPKVCGCASTTRC